MPDDRLEVVRHQPLFDEVRPGEGQPHPGGWLRQVEVDDDRPRAGESVLVTLLSSLGFSISHAGFNQADGRQEGQRFTRRLTRDRASASGADGVSALGAVSGSVCAPSTLASRWTRVCQKFW